MVVACGRLFLQTEVSVITTDLEGFEIRNAFAGLAGEFLTDLVNVRDTLYCTSESGVFRSLNCGQLWTPFDRGLRDPESPVCLGHVDGEVYIGTHGGSIYQLILPDERWEAIGSIDAANRFQTAIKVILPSATRLTIVAENGIWYTARPVTGIESEQSAPTVQVHRSVPLFVDLKMQTRIATHDHGGDDSPIEIRCFDFLGKPLQRESIQVSRLNDAILLTIDPAAFSVGLVFCQVVVCEHITQTLLLMCSD
jgi:hypothetical protein